MENPRCVKNHAPQVSCGASDDRGRLWWSLKTIGRAHWRAVSVPGGGNAQHRLRCDGATGDGWRHAVTVRRAAMMLRLSGVGWRLFAAVRRLSRGNFSFGLSQDIDNASPCGVGGGVRG